MCLPLFIGLISKNSDAPYLSCDRCLRPIFLISVPRPFWMVMRVASADRIDVAGCTLDELA